jgi:predicted negative regulator of RcsB-dependent stress response
VRAETRHQLKQDRFSKVTIDAAEATVHWSAEHKGKLVAGIVAFAVIVAAIAGGWYYLNTQDEKASTEVSQAVRVLSTPVRPANMPAQPDQPSYASVKERAADAQKKFQAIIDKYPHTHAAEVSRYFVGITANDQGDTATAESNLKAVSTTSNDDLAALAKMALAAVYRNSNRAPQAIDLYKQLINKPTNSVGKTTAEMELASTYETANQPLEAKRIYEQIQKESPTSEAAQMAAAKVKDLK